MTTNEKNWRKDLNELVQVLRRREIHDERVIAAMSKVRRHVYIPEKQREGSDPYGDHPCPIGYGQTISQPYIVAYMTQQLELKPGNRVLEIGTGSGYQSAILAEMGCEIFSIETIPELAAHAQAVLGAEGYQNVTLKFGDGYNGWAEHAPFDAIIVTCAPVDVPEILSDQLKDGGRMVVPVGEGIQQLILQRKEGELLLEDPDMFVRFVPMVKGR